ncbi:hypothetical protein [Chondromyces crocatus]|uniref:Uncharacterized protein n=1 Tax=Chondromyces crocatus TaxID=52 RepID=A0A0K1E633_CHOCO|nr:hypothetical protein [Chondromyces crocatus]AKT36028.1 uncharacterized protein CMC5_001400 [Chondromyces crocatus]
MSNQFRIYDGTHSIDLSLLQGKLVDMADCRGLRPDQDGLHEVKVELEKALPISGASAGVPSDAHAHFVMCNETVDQIDQHLVVAKKLVEVLEESRAFYVDARNNDISLIADSLRSRAHRRKDPSILLPFERTLRYPSQAAEKAVRTRRKNAEEAANAETTGADRHDMEEVAGGAAPPSAGCMPALA